MITGIVLENFKCFRRVEINPKRVTCFVGANGTGKSSVLQAFGLLKQTVALLIAHTAAWPTKHYGCISGIHQSPLDLQGPLANFPAKHCQRPTS